MPRPISIQMYSLRERAKVEGLPKMLKLVADMGYAGIEFAGYGGLAPAELKKVCDDLGLQVSGAHASVYDVAKAQEVIDAAKALGATCVGGGFGPKDFETEDQIKANADKANAAIEKISAAGLKVYYHNHWWEWDAPNKGDLLFERCPKLYAQWDIYWLQTAGADPAATIKKYADRTLLLHVKDGPCDREQPMTAVGKGIVKTKEALAAADETKAEWYIVELDRCGTDMAEAVRESYTYLTGNGLATGRK